MKTQEIPLNKIVLGDCRNVLQTFPDNSIDCCVTSPPYFGLRDYGHDNQIGLEDTPESFINTLVQVFIEVRRVLKPEGTLWLNLGDSYNGYKGNAKSKFAGSDYAGHRNQPTRESGYGLECKNLKPKDLIGIPWMAAFALRSAGWYLRQDIIWHKPNPMPESVTDRCTKAHEYIFLFSKSQKYHYDHHAIMQDVQPVSVERMKRGVSDSHKNVDGEPGQRPHSMNQPRENVRKSGNKERVNASERGVPNGSGNVCASVPWEGSKANKRSVWSVSTKPFSEAHFATYPEELIVDCIKAGCPEGGTVLDPFMGAGTTAIVASKLNRNFVGIELNPEYKKIAEKRIVSTLGIFSPIADVQRG